METRREFLKKAAAGAIAGIAASRAQPAPLRPKGEKTKVSLDQAQEVHSRALIIDGHNDMPVERVARGEKSFDWRRRDPQYHTDIPRMKEGGYDVGFFVVGNGLVANVWVATERMLAQIDAHPDELTLVLSSKDAAQTHQARKIGVMMSIEGAAKWLDGKVDILRILYRLGVRLLGVSHGEGGDEPTDLQGAKSHFGLCTPADREAERKNARGLTPFGLEVLKASNELGILTDLSHINDKAFYEVLEHSSKPPIMSHTAVFSLCPHWRCLTDDQIKALASAGGAMGVAFAPGFIHPDRKQATIDRLVEHICYVADLVGVDYVGIGSDFDGLGRNTIPVVPDVSQLVHLTRSMLAHGMSEEEIQKVWGGNFLRLLKRNIDARVPEK
jgi:membrane dipeptidase